MDLVIYKKTQAFKCIVFVLANYFFLKTNELIVPDKLIF